MRATSEPRNWRRWSVIGLVVVAAGCAPSAGGCSPVGQDGGSTTTTQPDGSTTTVPDGSTTTTEPDGSTTTTTEPDGSSTTTTVPDGTGPTELVDTLEVEDCFTPADGDSFVEQVRVVECTVPHQMEVYAQYTLDEELEFPGGNELTWAAQDECRERFEDYVGESYWDSMYDLRTLTPSFSTWDEGDREITCLLVDGQGAPLTEMARDSGR